MKLWSVLGVASSLLVTACSGITIGNTPGDTGPDADEEETVDETVIAGANQNDRSKAVEGEELRTGAMVVSPSGRYIVMQRNTQTVLYDATAARFYELPSVLRRIAFAKSREIVFADVSGGIQAIDLATRATLWNANVPGGASSMLRVSDDDRTLLVATGSGVHVVDAASGTLRGSNAVAGPITYAAFVPAQSRALLVGPTVWRDGGPHTPVYAVDLTGVSTTAASVDVPNCEAPIVVTPDASRAFLSPTYCSPGKQAVPGQTWTNPDPVSVIELGGGSLSFNKNLPGFGPVVMSKDGARVVAYLDVKRMDPAMFDDPDQVPWSEGERYHLMTIDPVTLRFKLARIGNAIPRFAMTADGLGLLVDASAKASSRTKIAARASVSIGPDGISGSAEANIDVFGSSAAFGYFDIGAQSFTAFSGPKAPLDRFVQFANGRYVLTLATRADGNGGTPYLIDLAQRTTWQVSSDYSRGVRDVGLSADGSVALIRVRLPAIIHDGGYYGREALCFSADGTCRANFDATFEASTPFATVPPPPPAQPDRDPYADCPDRSEC